MKVLKKMLVLTLVLALSAGVVSAKELLKLKDPLQRNMMENRSEVAGHLAETIPPLSLDDIIYKSSFDRDLNPDASLVLTSTGADATLKIVALHKEKPEMKRYYVRLNKDQQYVFSLNGIPSEYRFFHIMSTQPFESAVKSLFEPAVALEPMTEIVSESAIPETPGPELSSTNDRTTYCWSNWILSCVSGCSGTYAGIGSMIRDTFGGFTTYYLSWNCHTGSSTYPYSIRTNSYCGCYGEAIWTISFEGQCPTFCLSTCDGINRMNFTVFAY